MNAQTTPLDDYQLLDRYRRESGRVFLTGTQALVRLPLMQRELDRRRGLNTAGFISGYRGSPLGGYDQALWAAREFLDAADITFHPGINEELAATAVMGTQQVETEPDRRVDGVFALWYGKGPGVDRAGDALKHGNAYGSSPNGGVLMLFGDDHGSVSSSMSHQSDVAAMSWYAPTVHPAGVAEYLEFGLWGWAMSRFSGMWVAFKAISEVVESGASVELPAAPVFHPPEDFIPPADGLHFRWPDLPGMQIENRMVAKKAAVLAFAKANPIDRRIYDIADARMGIITTGKAHADLMEALVQLGIDAGRAREIGLDVYKMGMVWPIEPYGVRAFLKGKEEVLVVEEKRGLIESQLKELLYDYPGDKPKRMVGKYDENFRPLLSWTEEFSPSYLAPLVARRLQGLFGDLGLARPLARLLSAGTVEPPGGARRLPYFCSGCPHNTSTRVPEGSKALAGIGCHFMASWMNRDTGSLIQMGGEGIGWVGKSRYLQSGHIFQNLGEGTYFHSGHLAVRQAIAAGINITYKILYNNAVAMTGGQPVDGQLSVAAIAAQVRAEGARRVAVVSDEPDKYRGGLALPTGVKAYHRDRLDALQREFREIPGTTVIIYDQTCAAEKRRLRKKNRYPDPAKRAFINTRVCEGCGDCSLQSNCLSVFPVATEFGRKRKIDQNSCNKDYSCVNGFCPSFVTVEGGGLRRTAAAEVDGLEARLARLPEPAAAPLVRPYELLVGGVGGTGVVTVGALISMAAHLEGKGASVLDFTGFAQKGGTVLSYVRLGADPAALNQVRIDYGAADALIACDMLVGTDPRALRVLRKGHSRVVLNLAELPSADFVLDRDADMQAQLRVATLREAVGAERVVLLDANRLAERLLGHTVYSNVLLLGYAWQLGLVPVGLAALSRAIEINGVAVEDNRRGLAWGRLAAVDLDVVRRAAGIGQDDEPTLGLDELVRCRAEFLSVYQDQDYARSYREFIDRVRDTETALGTAELPLSEAVAQNLFKLMAYKDEYEVARLYTDGEFLRDLEQTFEGDYKIRFHFAPPLFAWRRDGAGRPKKLRCGPWLYPALKLLAKGKTLRGGPLDPFGKTGERRRERQLIEDYKTTVAGLLPRLSAGNRDLAVELARLPEQIRGYGPVKEAAVDQAQSAQAELVKRFAAV